MIVSKAIASGMDKEAFSSSRLMRKAIQSGKFNPGKPANKAINKIFKTKPGGRTTGTGRFVASATDEYGHKSFRRMNTKEHRAAQQTHPALRAAKRVGQAMGRGAENVGRKMQGKKIRPQTAQAKAPSKPAATTVKMKSPKRGPNASTKRVVPKQFDPASASGPAPRKFTPTVFKGKKPSPEPNYAQIGARAAFRKPTAAIKAQTGGGNTKAIKGAPTQKASKPTQRATLKQNVGKAVGGAATVASVPTQGAKERNKA